MRPFPDEPDPTEAAEGCHPLDDEPLELVLDPSVAELLTPDVVSAAVGAAAAVP